MEDLAQFVDGQCITMLYVCDQMILLVALGNRKLHGIKGRHIFVRRPWVAGHLTASLKKDFAGKVLASHREMLVSKEDLLEEEMVLLGEVWLSLRHEQLQKSKTSGQWRSKTAEAGSYSGKMSSFPKSYFNFLVVSHQPYSFYHFITK